MNCQAIYGHTSTSCIGAQHFLYSPCFPCSILRVGKIDISLPPCLFPSIFHTKSTRWHRGRQGWCNVGESEMHPLTPTSLIFPRRVRVFINSQVCMLPAPRKHKYSPANQIFLGDLEKSGTTVETRWNRNKITSRLSEPTSTIEGWLPNGNRRALLLSVTWRNLPFSSTDASTTT